jgi:uncharacterized membrane protein YfcA
MSAGNHRQAEDAEPADNRPPPRSRTRMREMLKQILPNGRCADPGLLNAVIIVTLGLGFVIAEGAMLSLHGQNRAAIALMAILIASAAASIAGFAFSAMCGALLFHLMDSPVYAVQVMIVCSIAMQSFSVAALWQTIDWRALPVFLIGGVAGVPAGAWLLLHLSTGVYREVIGALLVAYGCYMLMRWPTRTLRAGPLADVGAGFLGGFTGGLAGFPGAFVTIWCGLKGWDKARQRGVYQPFILCMQPVGLIAIHLMRPASSTAPQLDWNVLAFVPAALLGTWFGLRIFRRLSDRQFQIAVNVLLVAAGAGLIL